MRSHPLGGDAECMHDLAEPCQYRIRVRGHLGDTLLAAFPGLNAEIRGGDTVLTGTLRDQAALHGLLAETEALGLVLLEVFRQDP